MYGLAGFDKHLTDSEAAADMQDFETALHELADHPPGNSQALVSFSAAAVNALHDENFPEFRQLTDGFIRGRVDMVAPYKVQLFWRAFQYVLLERTHDALYPAAYGNELTWQMAFRTILTDRPGKMNPEGWALKEMLDVNNNQTNEPRRYAGIKLAIAAYARELPAAPSLVDAGCSAGLGQIQIGENIPFRGIQLEAGLEVRKLLRDRLMAKLAISNNIGFDKVVGIDPKWVEACSYYPSELEDTKLNQSKRRFREFLYRRRRNFVRLHGDLTEGPDSLDDIIDRNQGQPYDVATALTSLYEIPKDQLAVATDSLESLSGKLVVVQDFAEIDKHDPTKLVFAEDIYAPDSKYQLFSKLKANGDDHWTHLGTWSSGRCARFKPTDALIERCLTQK